MGAFRARWVLAAAVTAVLSVGLPGTQAWAKKGPKVFSARINGRQLVAHGRRAFGNYAGSIFSFGGFKTGRVEWNQPLSTPTPQRFERPSGRLGFRLRPVANQVR